MPFINIRIVKEAIADDPAGKKASIAADVTAAIQKATGLSENDVWVVFDEVPAADWYVGKTSVAERRRS
ncbi:tautomerase family protein [Devosia elaeis]|uniref:4-oxalocrotonate tautomerase n=1 Tax=Devosia elaeis TaxID=1770058 RepID=A0A178HZT0_9HYPH|nr:4-oxalocrotonate tautomerase family protein [Devosia elaeis]NMA97657.1 4-oxalocrotonate tautomerase family protein [Phyllobacteriaceae bacterium]OAM77458.1 4-oxalocrotonate tautomerase [Devosia elaeis]